MRRGHHQGTISLRRDGRWDIRVTLPNGKRKCLYARTEEEAERRLAEALAALGHPAVMSEDDRPRFSPSRVYLIAGGGLYKIGYAINIRKRFAELQNASPVPLSLLAYGRLGDGLANEAALHERYARKRTHGEWFRLDDDDVQAVMDALNPTGGAVTT